VADKVGRMSWLNGTAAPLMRGCAEFWTSRVELGPDNLFDLVWQQFLYFYLNIICRFHINNVMPPDEVCWE
jgi:hypothetical protein